MSKRLLVGYNADYELNEGQKKIVEIDTEQTAAILVLSDKVNGKK